jgi:deoxyribose-phosphate aldolase
MHFPEIPIRKEELASESAGLVRKAPMLQTPEMLKMAFSCIDMTTLNPTDTVSHVSSFTQKVNEFGILFPGLPSVAAICVYPNLTSVVRENLAVEEVKVAAVAGGFPSSMTFPELKTEEARMAVLNGADEIDIVLPLWAFLEENYEYCRREIESIKKSIGDTCLKVILESGVLSEPDKIWKASILSLEAGADFIKTSTGKMPVAATPEAAVVMCRAILYFYEVTGSKRGFKAAGGITTPEEAMVYVSVVKEILGESWLEKDFFRIGASRLANQLLSAILGQKITHF